MRTLVRFTALVVTFISCFSSGVFAGDCPAVVYFGNGITTTEDATKLTRDLVRERVNEALTHAGKLPLAFDCFDYAYATDGTFHIGNVKVPYLADLAESAGQIVLDDYSKFWNWLSGNDDSPETFTQAVQDAMKSTHEIEYATSEDLQKQVSKYRNTISTTHAKVVVIAHSQGNLFANQAFSALSTGADGFDAIKSTEFSIVSVATPQSFVATGEAWTTLYGDIILAVPTSLPANTDVDGTPCHSIIPQAPGFRPIQCHSFDKSYMVGLFSKPRILNQVITSVPNQSAQVIGGPVINASNGHTYYLTTPATWTESEAKALTLGGHLATVRSKAEQDWIFSKFSTAGATNRHLWVGFRSLTTATPAAAYTWVTGEASQYSNWDSVPGEPNGPGSNELYVHMTAPHYSTDENRWGTWNNCADNCALRPFGVVEIASPQPPTNQPPTARFSMSVASQIAVSPGALNIVADSVTGEARVTFQDQSTDSEGQIASRRWTTNTGCTPADPPPCLLAEGPTTFTWGFTPGSYTITLSVEDDGHAIDTALAVVNVTPPAPLPRLTTLPNTGFATEGGADPFWLLASGPTCLEGNCPVFSEGDPSVLALIGQNSQFSKWITPITGTGSVNPPGQYIYRLAFTLTDTEATDATISGRWAVDDVGVDILINGVSTGSQGAPSFVFSPFTLNNGFRPGTNTLDFVVQNADCPSCPINPVALRVELFGAFSSIGGTRLQALDDAYTVQTGMTLSVPSPGNLSNDTLPENLTRSIVTLVNPRGQLEPGLGGFVYTPPVGFVGVDEFFYYVVVHSGSVSAQTNLARVAITVTPSASCVLPPSGLLGWWPGDGDSQDIILRNNGTPVGPLTFAAGRVAQAFDFGGSLDRVQIPDRPSITFDTNTDYSIEFWLKTPPHTSTIHQASLVEKWSENVPIGGYPFAIRLNTGAFGAAGTVQAGAYDGVNNPTVSGTRRVDDDTWHHVAAVFGHSQKTLTLYVDGSLENSATYTALGSISNNLPILLGIRSAPSADREAQLEYGGLLDEVSIYDRSLDASEIRGIFLSGYAGKCPPEPLTPLTAIDDTYLVSQGGVLAIDAPGVLANDGIAVPQGTGFDVDFLTVPDGTIENRRNGSFRYTPTPNFSGVTSFTYVFRTLLGTSNVATVTLNVRAPVVTLAFDGGASATFGQPVIDSAGALYVARSQFGSSCGFGFCGASLQKIVPGSATAGWRTTEAEIGADSLAPLRLAVGPGNRIYFQTRNRLLAYDADGTKSSGLWPVEFAPFFNNWFVSSTLIDGPTGEVFAEAATFGQCFNSCFQYIRGLRPDGSELWQKQFNAGASLTLGSNRDVYVGDGSQAQMIRFDRESGIEVCRSTVHNIGGWLGTPEGLFAANGASIRHFKGDCTNSQMYSANVTSYRVHGYTQGRVFGSEVSGSIVQLFGVTVDGQSIWRQGQIAPDTNPIRAINNNVLYVLGLDKVDGLVQKLFLVHATTGDILSRISLTGLCQNCGIAVAPSGSIFINDLGSTKIFKVQ